MSSPLERGAYRKVRAPSPGLSPPIVATSDFSGFESSDCALASAAASAPIDSLDRYMGSLRFWDVETHRSGSRPAGTDPMADRLLGIFRQKGLQVGFGSFVFDSGLTRPEEDTCGLRPAVRGTHVDHPDACDAGTGRFDAE